MPSEMRHGRFQWKRALVVGVLPAAMLLAACGDDDSTPMTGAGDATSSPTAAMMSTPSGSGASNATGTSDAATTPTMDHSMMTPTTGVGATPTTGSTTGSPTTGGATGSPVMTAEVTSDTGAAALRATLTNLLQEHVYLAGAATGAALGGRDAEFEAAAATLDQNSMALSEAIGSVYGADAGETFLALWRTHIGFFVDYTTGVATNDQAMIDQALADLDAYRFDFGAFLESANPNLPADAVAAELQPHVETLTAAIDAQAAGDPEAYMLLKEAANHMPMTAAILAGGIAAQFPEQFDGEVDAPAADLRAGLNALLQEHVYLAGFATGAALDGRTEEFEAAAAALDANSVELSEAIGSVYGPDAEEAFLPLWRSHIGFFVDYTTAVATGDQAAADQAVDNLVQYSTDFAAFLNSANGLPVDVVEGLLQEHALGLKAAVDAQAAGDHETAYAELRTAAMHMQMIADPLAEATVQTFPDAFTS